MGTPGGGRRAARRPSGRPWYGPLGPNATRDRARPAAAGVADTAHYRAQPWRFPTPIGPARRLGPGSGGGSPTPSWRSCSRCSPRRSPSCRSSRTAGSPPTSRSPRRWCRSPPRPAWRSATSMIAARKGLGSLHADFGLAFHPRDLGWFVGRVRDLRLLGRAHRPHRRRRPSHRLVPGRRAALPAVPRGRQRLLRPRRPRHRAGRGGAAVPGGAAARPPAPHRPGRRGRGSRPSSSRSCTCSSTPAPGSRVPALLLLGLVSGYRALKTGDLSESILLHAGFNLLAVLQILT